jgi:hypothetical protein
MILNDDASSMSVPIARMAHARGACGSLALLCCPTRLPLYVLS